MYKVEMHSHSSPGSCDSEISSKELVELCKKNGYSGVVLTNHYDWYALNSLCSFDYNGDYHFPVSNDRKAQEVVYGQAFKDWCNNIVTAKEYGEEVGIKVYCGMEYSIGCSHISILGLNIEKCYKWAFVPPNLSFDKLRESLPGALLIINHPNRYFDDDREEIIIKADGYEIVNTKSRESHYEERSYCSMDAREYICKVAGPDVYKDDKIFLVGSDVHQEEDFGRSSVDFEELPKDEVDMVRMLREGKYKNSLHFYL